MPAVSAFVRLGCSRLGRSEPRRSSSQFLPMQPGPSAAASASALNLLLIPLCDPAAQVDKISVPGLCVGLLGLARICGYHSVERTDSLHMPESTTASLVFLDLVNTSWMLRTPLRSSCTQSYARAASAMLHLCPKFAPMSSAQRQHAHFLDLLQFTQHILCSSSSCESGRVSLVKVACLCEHMGELRGSSVRVSVSVVANQAKTSMMSWFDAPPQDDVECGCVTCNAGCQGHSTARAAQHPSAVAAALLSSCACGDPSNQNQGCPLACMHAHACAALGMGAPGVADRVLTGLVHEQILEPKHN